jgi:hypothetical protein
MSSTSIVVKIAGSISLGIAASTASLVGATASSTAPTSVGQHGFCRDWGKFGDNPSYPNLIQVSGAEIAANKGTKRDFLEFRYRLLHNLPVRSQSAKVWHDCGR